MNLKEMDFEKLEETIIQIGKEEYKNHIRHSSKYPSDYLLSICVEPLHYWLKDTEIADYLAINDSEVDEITDIDCPYQALMHHAYYILMAIPECMKLKRMYGIEKCLKVAESYLDESKYTIVSTQMGRGCKDWECFRDIALSPVRYSHNMYAIFLFMNEQTTDALEIIKRMEFDIRVNFLAFVDIFKRGEQ